MTEAPTPLIEFSGSKCIKISLDDADCVAEKLKSHHYQKEDILAIYVSYFKALTPVQAKRLQWNDLTLSNFFQAAVMRNIIVYNS